MKDKVCNEVLVGRPFGGLAILWRKSIVAKPVMFEDDRLMGLEVINKSNGNLLIMNVYLPYDSNDNYDSFCEYLERIDVIFQSGVTPYVMAIGDFNAHPGSKFGQELCSFADENEYVVADLIKLTRDGEQPFTYFSEAHNTCRWLDHCMVSTNVVSFISDMSVSYDVISSDHFPLTCVLDIESIQKVNTVTDDVSSSGKIIWKKATPTQLQAYRDDTEVKLGNINVPLHMSQCRNAKCKSEQHVKELLLLYSEIIDVLADSGTDNIPSGKNRDYKHIPGWNDVIKDVHNQARDAFKLWCVNNKPRQGPIYELMRKTRAHFKYTLRQCKKEEILHRANALAKEWTNKNAWQFWKKVNYVNPKGQITPQEVNGARGDADIAKMWKNHYAELFNSVTNVKDKQMVEHNVYNNDYDENVEDVVQSEVKSAISRLSNNKAIGPDGIAAEHLKFAGSKLIELLSICYTGMLIHGYLPDTLMTTHLIPVLKNKMGDVTDVANYRPIAIASVLSKTLEKILLTRLEDYLYTSDLQFGFKKGHSTDMAIYALKEIVSYYKEHDSPVFICFLDASKAFDRINHWCLFKKLLDRKVPVYIVRILLVWYRNQLVNIKWNKELSSDFTVTNGVKQGGIISPYLFNIYLDELSDLLSKSPAGCRLGGVTMNHLIYADDMCLIAPSPHGMQKLLNICELYAEDQDIIYNSKKTVCMLMQSRKVKFKEPPALYLNRQRLDYADSCRYLGYIVSNTGSDDDDVKRQKRSLYATANRLKRQFVGCSFEVKKQLFTSYCSNLYCAQLWSRFTQASWSSVRVAYNNACRIVLGLERFCSASNMFVFNEMCNFEALLRKNIFGFISRILSSQNVIMTVLTRMSCGGLTELGKRWYNTLY